MIGVHAPEFAFERDPGNVRKAVADLGIRYPVALDNDFAIWRAFKNRYWPAHYFVDAQGRIRYHHFGEGEYETSERVIRAAAGRGRPRAERAAVARSTARGRRARSRRRRLVRSPETYLGYGRAANFASPGGLVRDRGHAYRAGAAGAQPMGARRATGRSAGRARGSTGAGGRIAFRFHARDLHLVLGSADGRPVRFRVTIDGKAPGADAGMDVDAPGDGRVTDQRLYQLVRQKAARRERTVQDRVPRSRRRGLRLHLRLTGR